MENVSNRLHPLVAGAAVAVIALAATGMAAITGILPVSKGQNSPETVLAAPAPLQAAPAILQAPLPASAPPVVQAQPKVQELPRAQTPPATRTVASRTIAPVNGEPPLPAPPARVADAPVPLQQMPYYPPQPDQRYEVRGPVAMSEPRIAERQPVAQAACIDCCVIESIRAIEQSGNATGMGAVAGGVAGAVVGKQIGNGRGQTLASVLGAIGGAFAGHEVEKRVRTTKRYEITVRFDNGTTRVVNQDAEPAWRQGERVRLLNGALAAS